MMIATISLHCILKPALLPHANTQSPYETEGNDLNLSMKQSATMVGQFKSCSSL